jgi:NAD(P)-dependent dehydrogenase (short-subunit alcohol dehydrogenase family)
MRVLIFGQSDIGLAISKIYRDTIMLSKEECDVRDKVLVRSSIKKIGPEVIVNCAAISTVQRCLNSNYENWVEEINVNLIGSFIIASEAINYETNIKMIFFASVAGLYGKAEHSGYSASKAGVISLVQSLGLEGHNAYAISPGRVNTKMREKDFPGEDIRTRLTTKQVANVVKQCVEEKYNPGDNIIIRKRGFQTLRRIDNGQPWRAYLNVQYLGEPKII